MMTSSILGAIFEIGKENVRERIHHGEVREFDDVDVLQYGRSG